SPFFVDHRGVPKPIMYWLTRTLKSFAGTRWPISCRAMDTAIPTAMMRIPMRARTKVIGVLVEHDEQLYHGKKKGIDLCLVISVGTFLSSERGVADVLDTNVFFVLEVSGNSCHACFDIGYLVALYPGIGGPEFFAAWPL